MAFPKITIEYPPWVGTAINWGPIFSTDEEKMRLAIRVSRLNVTERTGGPFGAAIFEQKTGRLISVGMNLVVANNNAILHGEIVALMMAQQRLANFTLTTPGGPGYTLATSCEPCAMCLGATLWGGVSRLICGANRDDAHALDFDEGPVYPSSYAYLAERGIEITREVCREEAAEVMDLYRKGGGIIYNG